MSQEDTRARVAASPFIKRKACHRNLIRMSRIVKLVKYFCIFQLVQPFTGRHSTEKTLSFFFFFLKSPFHWEPILCLTIQRMLFRDFNCSVDLWLDLNNQNNKIIGFLFFLTTVIKC